MSGVISDRLRKELPRDDPSWNPPRGTDTARLPSGVVGIPLGGRTSK